jgi:hypothetical protein
MKKLWKNEYFQTAIVIGLIALTVFGFWYGLQIALNTQYPGLAVLSGSMCVPYNSACDGWTSITHPFAQTLHKGDLIIIQGINPQDLNVNYPNSDIIVFQDPRRPTDPDAKIVHRIVDEVEMNGRLYFYTKGDGNSPSKWPDTPDPVYYDNWHSDPSNPNGTYNGAVSQEYVYGKVIMRIPWLGHIVLFMNPNRNPWGLSIVIALITIIVIVEFIVPLLKDKKKPEQQKEVQKET